MEREDLFCRTNLAPPLVGSLRRGAFTQNTCFISFTRLYFAVFELQSSGANLCLPELFEVECANFTCIIVGDGIK